MGEQLGDAMGTGGDEPLLWRLTNEQFMAPRSSLHVERHALSYRVSVHWHEFYEMFFVVAGMGTHILNGTPHALAAGSLFLLTPADFHELIPQPGTTLDLYNVIFSDDVLADEVRGLLFDDVTDDAVMCEGADRDGIEAEFCRLWTEETERAVGYRRVMQGTLERILVELARRRAVRGGAGRRQATGQHPKIHKALVYLHHHFREALTLDQVAAQSHLSPHYFSECFHKATGVPFQTYLRELRLRFARSLLQVADMPITEICYASGFATLSHFERAFKQRYGKPPRAYRQGGKEPTPAVG